MSIPSRVASLAALALLVLAGCGAASSSSSSAPATRARATLSSSASARLDAALRARLSGSSAAATRFPVRVLFTEVPSREELAAMLLVPYERGAIGNVDRETLRNIAERPDVEQIALLEGVPDDEPDEP